MDDVRNRGMDLGKRWKPALAYARVSSEGQGRRGLGIRGQLAQIDEFAARAGYRIAEFDTFTDVGSGREKFDREKRPGFVKALTAAMGRNCPIIVADFSRISRRSKVIVHLCNHPKLTIISADVGDGASYAVIQGKAIRASEEGEEISRRTKEGLRKAKARGVKLGNPDLSHVRQLGASTNKARGKARAQEFKRILDQIRSAGITSAKKIADELNMRGVKTPQKLQWTETNVRRVQKQIMDFDRLEN